MSINRKRHEKGAFFAGFEECIKNIYIYIYNSFVKDAN